MRPIFRFAIGLSRDCAHSPQASTLFRAAVALETSILLGSNRAGQKKVPPAVFAEAGRAIDEASTTGSELQGTIQFGWAGASHRACRGSHRDCMIATRSGSGTRS